MNKDIPKIEPEPQKWGSGFYMNEKALKALNKYIKYLTEFYKI